jgi:hypothetical protein
VIWGRNHDTWTQHNLNSYLAETVVPIGKRNFLTGIIELVDKDELFADMPDLEAQLDRTAGSTFRIGAYTAGLHAGHSVVQGRGNRDRRQCDRIYAPGSNQTVLRQAAVGDQRLCASSTEAEQVTTQRGHGHPGRAGIWVVLTGVISETICGKAHGDGAR